MTEDRETLSRRVISDIITYTKYARHVNELGRRETWTETVDRSAQMHIRKFPQLEKEIRQAFQLVHEKKVLPSMRGLQFSGKSIEIAPNRLYNCSFLAIDSWQAFHEIMFLLLGGSGVGFSVQKQDIAQLPPIRKPTRVQRRILVQDSIIGWADTIKILMKSYFYGLSDPVFDFRDIREKGIPLKTAGGVAPGPEPLALCVQRIRSILDSKKENDQLTPIEAHDIVCIIADAVLAGGIRRSALLSLFSLNDKAMLTAKHGSWYDNHPWRSRANNSANLLRYLVKRKDFDRLWNDYILPFGYGEPAPFFSNNSLWGANPCVEVSLNVGQMCNLSTVNVAYCFSQLELEKAASAASFIGTLQASYTDFHYLRHLWRHITEKEALLGVSLTGIVSNWHNIQDLDFISAAKVVADTNEKVASQIGINKAARLTCIKPEGTSSLALGAVTSGIHPAWSRYVARRLELNKSEPLYRYLAEHIPDLVEDHHSEPENRAYAVLPLSYPKDTLFRDEPALDTLERVKKFSNEWILPGHRDGHNRNNVSSTITVKENEWQHVVDWMWDNRDIYSGITTLPYDGGKYKQAPFTEINKAKFDELMQYVSHIDLSQVTESVDTTNLNDQIACAGGACQI